MKRLSIVLSILMFQAAVALPALAQSSSDEFKPGAYVQAAFAAQFSTSDLVDVTLSGDSAAFGGSIAGGYFLTNWLAVQGRAQFIDTGSLGPISSLTYIYGAQAKLYVLNLLMSNPNGLIQPYAIAGIGGLSVTGSGFGFTDSENFFTFELGAGLDLMFTNHLGLFGEFNWQYINANQFFGTPVDSPNNIGMNIGVTYRF